MQLSLAKEEDLPIVVKLVENVFNQSQYSLFGSFNSIDCFKLGLSILRNDLEGIIVVLKNDGDIVGAVVGQIFEQPFNRNIRTAAELAFWIDDDFRNYHSIHLLYGSFRKWAKIKGCHLLQFGKIKEAKKPEVTFMKRLK